jgi:hypothetical protein
VQLDSIREETMKGQIYVIYDALAEQYSPPFYAPNEKVAVRSFLQTVGSIANNADFKLRCLGYFNLEEIDEKCEFYDIRNILLEDPSEVDVKWHMKQMVKSESVSEALPDDNKLREVTQ